MIVALEYIKYRWIAKGRHGIHSPFVYDYLDTCQKIRLSKTDKATLRKLTAELSKDKSEIQINDFGAGSRKMGEVRKISDIFRTSSSYGKYGLLLYQLAKHYKPASILEFGTSLGVGTTYLNLGNPNAKITTIEACNNTRKRAIQHLGDISNIKSINSTFDDFLNDPIDQKFDLVFVDGHHDGTALLDYMNRLAPITHDKTVFVLDDIRWSNSMFESWNTLIESNEYHLSIDHFRVGIIARRSIQEKEHFILKL